jgi:hypothetical protein
MRDEVDVVAEEMPYGGNRYYLCTWRHLYHHICALPPGGRHFYVMTVDWHSRYGIPLLLDIDFKPGTTRDEVMRTLAKILEAVDAPCLVDDACSLPGQKPSLHIISRAVAFRNTKEAREYAQLLKATVSDAIDGGIPKSDGLYKLPGNTKAQVGKRGQRPNHACLYDMPPLTGQERYEDVVSWDEFWQRRPWLSEDEARKAKWPMGAPVSLQPPPRALQQRDAYRQYYETQFDWANVLKWGRTLQLRFLDLNHNAIMYEKVETYGSAEIVREAFLRPGTRVPLALHALPPDLDRWLVFDLDLRVHRDYGDCATRHSVNDVCDTCMALARRVVARLRLRIEPALGLAHPTLMYYTGSNGVHLWYELVTRAQVRTLSRISARRLFFDRVIKPLQDAWGANELQAGAKPQFVRVPGCLHDATSRAPVLL